MSSVTSLVIKEFRAAVVADPGSTAVALDPAFGSIRDDCELNRAVLLGNLAAKYWIGGAIAARQHGRANALAELSQIDKPQDFRDLENSAVSLLRDPDSTVRELAAAAVRLAAAVKPIDSDVPDDMNRSSFENTAQAAAACLILAGGVRGGTFVQDEAGATLNELIPGWTRQPHQRSEKP